MANWHPPGHEDCDEDTSKVVYQQCPRCKEEAVDVECIRVKTGLYEGVCAECLTEVEVEI